MNDVGSSPWLADFATTTRAAVLRRAGLNTCVFSTRVRLAVLRRCGVLCRPRPVTFAAFTPDAVATLIPHPPPGVVGHREGHSVGVVGTGAVDPVTRRWDGHLVIELVTPPRLVDLSLDQASRPEKGLTLGPALIALPDGWGPPGSRAVLRDEHGALVIYEPMRCAPAWRTCPDWVGHPGRFQACVLEVLQRMGHHDQPPRAHLGVSSWR